MKTDEGIICIIQARLGSTRLPGKILMKMGEMPVLWHVIQRVKKSKSVNKIIIATTLEEKDDPIVDFCNQYAIPFFRGSEDDVLDRYYQAAEKFKSKIIVRVTSDCPLVDAQVIDELINLFQKKHCDYVCNNMPPNYPHGLDAEVFSFSALEKAWKEAKNQFEREHVTPYIRLNPNKFKIKNLSNKKDLSKIRWTLDFKEDLEALREIYKLLGGKALTHDFTWLDVLKIYNEHPYIRKINKNVNWKEIRTYDPNEE